jgi:hypothetical protein
MILAEVGDSITFGYTELDESVRKAVDVAVELVVGELDALADDGHLAA